MFNAKVSDVVFVKIKLRNTFLEFLVLSVFVFLELVAKDFNKIWSDL